MTLKKRNEIADRLEKNTSVDHEEGLELIRKFRKTGVFFQNDRGAEKVNARYLDWVLMSLYPAKDD